MIPACVGLDPAFRGARGDGVRNSEGNLGGPG